MLKDKNIAIELKCQSFVCKTCMQNEEGTESVLIFESKQRTEDVICPFCGGKVNICDLTNKHLRDVPIWPGMTQKLWFDAAKASGIPALVRFVELKEKRIDGLIAHAIYPISTGKPEGFNNKNKVAKRVGYGFMDDCCFFLLVRFLASPNLP